MQLTGQSFHCLLKAIKYQLPKKKERKTFLSSVTHTCILEPKNRNVPSILMLAKYSGDTSSLGLVSWSKPQAKNPLLLTY